MQHKDCSKSNSERLMQRLKKVQTVKHQVQIVIIGPISLSDWFITRQLKQLCDANKITRPWYTSTKPESFLWRTKKIRRIFTWTSLLHWIQKGDYAVINSDMLCMNFWSFSEKTFVKHDVGVEKILSNFSIYPESDLGGWGVKQTQGKLDWSDWRGRG